MAFLGDALACMEIYASAVSHRSTSLSGPSNPWGAMAKMGSRAKVKLRFRLVAV